MVRYVGDYELLAELGRGGMGVVYKARQATLKRLVALKMILSGEFASEANLARFKTEAEALARLQHPNIVQVYEIGKHEGKPYFSLEFCAGGSLEQKLRATPLPPREAAQLVQILSRAMHAAHQAHVIHRDLKPANVLLTADGTPKITDFGLAKKLDDVGQTQSGAIMGTPSYMAPEQAASKSKAIGPACDTYALGAILYELLTGRPPFKATTPLDTVLQVISDEPVPPRQLQSKTPRDLETICLKCLAKEPGRRYATALDLAEDLQRYQAGEPVRARPVGSVERGWRWCRRNPLPAALAAGVALTLILGATVAGYFGYEARREADRANSEAGEKELQARRAEARAEDARREKKRADEAAEQARKDAEAARLAGLAEQKSAEQARKDRDLAKDAERKMEEQLQRAEMSAYVIRITLAQVEWEHGSAALAWDHLEACQWNLRGWEHRYLAAKFNKNTLKGHTGAVHSVAFSPDGKRIVSGGGLGDNTLKVWDADKGTEVLSLKGHTDEVWSVAFSPDGKRIVSGGGSLFNRGTPYEIKVWDADKGTEVRTLKRHTDAVTSVAFSPDGKRIVSGSTDNTLRVWDADKGTEVRTLKGHTAPVSSVAFSPDGKRIFSGSVFPENTLKVWDADKGIELLSIKGGSGIVAFSPDGKRIVSRGGDRTLKVWDADKGIELLSLKGHTGSVTSVAFSPDGKRILSGAIGGVGQHDEIKVWDTDKGAEVFSLKGVGRTVAFSPDGKRIVSGAGGHFGQQSEIKFSGQPGEIKVWDADRGTEILTLKGHTGEVLCVAFSRDGKRIVSGGDKLGEIEVWDADKGIEPRTLKGHTSPVGSVAFSPDGKRIVSASLGGGLDPRGQPILGEIKLWDADKGTEVRTLQGHPAPFNSVAFSPDGKRIVSGSNETTLTVWDADKGTEVRTLKRHTDAVTSVAFSPDGKRIVSASIGDAVLLGWLRPGEIKLWDADKGTEVRTLKGHAGWVKRVAYSPDGKRIVSGSQDTTLKLWDADKGTEVRTLKGHTAPVSSVAFSPDGKRIVSGSKDNTVKVWDADKGQLTRSFDGHTGGVTSVAFSPDGKRIVSGGNDNTVKVWDSQTGQQILSLKGHTDVVTCVAFSPDGKRILSASMDYTVKVWDARRGQ